jgi:hypothetical protein
MRHLPLRDLAFIGACVLWTASSSAEGRIGAFNHTSDASKRSKAVADQVHAAAMQARRVQLQAEADKKKAAADTAKAAAAAAPQAVAAPGVTASQAATTAALESDAATSALVTATTDASSAEATAVASSAAASTPSSSPLSVGTMLGINVPLYNTTTYEVVNGTVRVSQARSAADYFQPSAFVLPSVSILELGTSTNLSVIVPFGLTAAGKSANLNIGVGAAVGWSLNKSEIGVGLAAVWTSQPYLSTAQQASLDSNKPIAAGEGQTIATRLTPSIALGLYITPQL